MQTKNFFQESAQRVEQQKRRKLMQDRRNKQDAEARDTRQYIKIGKLACKYFPSLLDCQPTNDKGESDELSFLEFVLKLYRDRPNAIRLLRDLYDRQKM